MTEKLPRHIAFIMDGNGRWAERRGQSRSSGHRAGVKALRHVVEAAFDKGIGIVSIYAFSTENWSRPEKEINELFKMLEDYVGDNTKTMISKGVRFSVMGDVSRLPESLQTVIADALNKTAACEKHILNIGLNYGSRPEILRAINNILSSGLKSVDHEIFERFLYTRGLPDPDLIIRTSGEQRLSNFMLYQAAYSEFFFPETCWPDFDEKELDKALEVFASRKRRFGKI